MRKAGDDEDDDGGDQGGAGGVKDVDAKARAAARANAAAASARGRESLKFATPVARGVYSTLFAAGARAAAVREMYQPRRTAFVYTFDDEDTVDTDVPTTMRRPKSECPTVRPCACVGLHGCVAAGQGLAGHTVHANARD